MRKVLFLASWYPSRVDPFNGDFIARHAKCVSLTNKVFVLFVVKDPALRKIKIVKQKDGGENLVEYIGYYPAKGRSRLTRGIYSARYFWQLHKMILKKIVARYGKPDIVHLNVMWKAGLVALWLKRKWKTPYVISENWTGYYPQRKDGFLHQSFLSRLATRRIFRKCDYFLPVTEDLGHLANRLFGKKKFAVIPNVVDTGLFFMNGEKRQDKFTFIHVSTLGYHKNILGILQGIEKLFQVRQDFELHLIGHPSPAMVQWVQDRGLLDKCVIFKGQLPYEDVAQNIRHADAMVMFSRYENLPCVILEALCCGVPVISSDVGGIREVVNGGNGILIPSENEEKFLIAMIQMLDNIEKYDRKKISVDAQKRFNYKEVGRQFDEVYQMVLH